MSNATIPFPVWKSRRRHHWRRQSGPAVIPMPAPPRSPFAVLGLTPPFTREQVKAAFRARSKVAHPDHGGTNEAFVALREAYEQALKACA